MAAIITPHNPTSGQYTTQYHVVQAHVQHQQPQQTHLVQIQRQGPQQQQVVIQQPSYQQQVVQQQPAVVHPRIIHTSPRQTVQGEEAPVQIRQFVTFKNLRHLNQPGQQWEHCEHITIALSPDELEKKIRCHDIPGNDLVNILTNMGVYRQRHVRKYEDKLNHRESDPSNWSWVLEALGELRGKPKATPHTFWAIFQRTPRRNSTQQSRQVRPQPQVTVHHEPVQIVEVAPVQHITAPVVPALPPPQSMLALSAPPPQQQQQQMLALPVPSAQQQQQQQQQAPPQYVQAIIQPASSIGGSSTSSYQINARQHQSAPQSQQAPMVYGTQQQQQQPQNTHAQNYQVRQQQQQQQQHYQAAQQHVVHTQAQMQNYQQPQMPQQSYRPALVPAAPAAPQALALRQITQGPAQSTTTTSSTTASTAAKPTTTARQYTRPIPQPINPATGRSSSPGLSPTYTRTSDIDLSQFRTRDNSLPQGGFPSPQQECRGWFDDDSDDSASSYVSSTGSTAMTDYSTKWQPAPFGGARTRSNASSQSKRRSGESMKESMRGRHPMAAPIAPSIGDRNYIPRNYTVAAPAPTHPPTPATARPQIQRQNTYDIEVKFGPTPRPAPPVRSTSFTESVPRSHVSRQTEDYDYECESSDGADFRRSGTRRSGYTKRPGMPRLSNNGYEAAGLVSYGSDSKERGRRF